MTTGKALKGFAKNQIIWKTAPWNLILEKQGEAPAADSAEIHYTF
jgi:hypothetical protein